MQPIDPRRTAVVVVDAANDFLFAGGVIADAGGPEYQQRAQAVLPTIAALCEAARASGATVLYTTDSHQPEDLELRKWPPHSMHGTWNAQLPEAVAPKPGDIVHEKRTYSPFVDPAFETMLRERGIDTLIIAGYHTDCCCRHTSGDAFQRGFALFWATDALQAFTEAQHQEGLEYYRRWYARDAAAQLQTTAELAARLGAYAAA